MEHSVTFYQRRSCQIWYSLLISVSRYWAKFRREYFRSPDFWWILLKRNCHNSRTSKDIDIKLGPVTKLDKRNKTTSKKIDVDVMSENCDVIVIFRIFGQFGAVRRPDSGHRVCKSYVFSNSNLLSYKNWKQN